MAHVSEDPLQGGPWTLVYPDNPTHKRDQDHKYSLWKIVWGCCMSRAEGADLAALVESPETHDSLQTVSGSSASDSFSTVDLNSSTSDISLESTETRDAPKGDTSSQTENAKLSALQKQLDIERKVKQGAENMINAYSNDPLKNVHHIAAVQEKLKDSQNKIASLHSRIQSLIKARGAWKTTQDCTGNGMTTVPHRNSGKSPEPAMRPNSERNLKPGGGGRSPGTGPAHKRASNMAQLPPPLDRRGLSRSALGTFAPANRLNQVTKPATYQACQGPRKMAARQRPATRSTLTKPPENVQEFFHKLCTNLWTQSRIRGRAFHLVVKEMAAWIRPATRRRLGRHSHRAPRAASGLSSDRRAGWREMQADSPNIIPHPRTQPSETAKHTRPTYHSTAPAASEHSSLQATACTAKPTARTHANRRKNETSALTPAWRKLNVKKRKEEPSLPAPETDINTAAPSLLVTDTQEPEPAGDFQIFSMQPVVLPDVEPDLDAPPAPSQTFLYSILREISIDIEFPDFLAQDFEEGHEHTSDGKEMVTNPTPDVCIRLRIPLTMEDFKLRSVLGRGTFGKVLLAKYKDTGNMYALKVIRKGDIESSSILDCLLIEKRVFQAVTNRRHPFLINMFGSFHTQDHAVFVMEYAAGGDLKTHLKRGPFPEPRAVFYLACVVLGLEFLHQQKIIHRDLKLDNIVLDDKGFAKITDFGLCKEGIGYGDTIGSAWGTPLYAAPEVLMGKPYTRAVDWWSAGVVSYAMLSGKFPFDSLDIDILTASIIKGTFLYPEGLSRNATSLIRQVQTLIMYSSCPISGHMALRHFRDGLPPSLLPNLIPK
ncbi:serine/threonine-protein kinase N2-like [Pelobates fuscus]|uniref:serine/threonine-protein kinase N2-like n=1 Tax=Pelobates fuscus TaxID=191477 RepID=UPI002FE4BFB5